MRQRTSRAARPKTRPPLPDQLKPPVPDPIDATLCTRHAIAICRLVAFAHEHWESLQPLAGAASDQVDDRKTFDLFYALEERLWKLARYTSETGPSDAEYRDDLPGVAELGNYMPIEQLNEVVALIEGWRNERFAGGLS